VRARPLAAIAAALTALALAACAPAGVFPGSGSAPDSAAPADPVPGEPATAVDGAIALGDGATQVDLWVDFFCPYCGMFEAANGDYLQARIEDGAVTVRVHPIAFLDRASMGTRYSTRAANAFLCVADLAPEQTLSFYRALFIAQPAEGTPGLSDDELAAIAPAAADGCIRGLWFDDWVGEWTQRAIDLGVQGTPTVLVDGARFAGGFDPEAFAAFVEGRAPVVPGTAV